MQAIMSSCQSDCKYAGDEHLREFISQLWMTCKEMIAMDGGVLCTGLGVLVLFAEHLGISGNKQHIDVTEDPLFWQQLRVALVSIQMKDCSKSRECMFLSVVRNNQRVCQLGALDINAVR